MASKVIAKLGALWHRAHPMPANATTGERIAWHVEHQEACACRPIPAKLAARMRAALGEASPRPRPSSTPRRRGGIA
jgi:hypothetical protein